MRGWWHDIVVGARAHLTNPGVTTVVVITLAFAIAANGVAFSLAARFWPETSVVGRHVTTPGGERFQVVGVSRYAKHLTLGEAPEPYLYFPLRQRDMRAMTVLVRGPGDPAALLRETRETVRTMNETLPLYNVSTMTDRVAVALLPARTGAMAVNAIGLVAILLAALGLYTTMAQVVGRRTREIGVRRALGAQDADVARLVVRQTTWHVLTGLAAGFALGLAGARFLGGLLYGVSTTDPVVFGGAPGALLAIAPSSPSPRPCSGRFASTPRPPFATSDGSRSSGTPAAAAAA